MTDLPNVAGMPFGGGIYAGRYIIGQHPFMLIVAPAAEGELAKTAWGQAKRVAGADSYADGLVNTEAMAAAGSKLAAWARALRLGDHADWYIPSRLEALLTFGELRASESFASDWYWTSTQYASYYDYAWCQSFVNGSQGYDHKLTKLRARAVRRLAIQ